MVGRNLGISRKRGSARAGPASSEGQLLVGRYRLDARVATGGTGEVYRARDTVLGRVVAVKVLDPDLSRQPGFVERFRAEARAAASLSQKDVVQVHDWGSADSTYFMVMEYVRGKDLRRILNEQGALAPAQAVAIAASICEALSAAHAKDLVHRDIKPENILLTGDGHVKVADFGIARAVAQGGPATAGLWGTVAYVSPEQLRGEPVDGRADVYSLGLLLFEMLVGHAAMIGESAAQVLQRHLKGEVPRPSEAGVDQEFDHLVAKSTAVNPADRYASAQELLEDLKAIETRLPAAAPLSNLSREVTSAIAPEHESTIVPKPGRTQRRWWVALAIAVLVTLGAAGAWAFFLAEAPVPSLVGKSRAQASALIGKQGLKPVVDYRFVEQDPGKVISQSPAPGTQSRRYGAVRIVVGRFSKEVTVPSLQGLPAAEARKLITSRGFTVGEIAEEFDAAVGVGLVVRQSLEAGGRAPRGKAIDFVVSKGIERIELGDVRGKPEAEALAVLKAAGFNVSREDVFDPAPVGVVVDQRPLVGVVVDKGSAVAIIVSKGPAPFPMIDVKGKGCAQAKAELEAKGLKVDVRSAGGVCSDSRRVIDQDPAPGTAVQGGEATAIYTQ